MKVDKLDHVAVVCENAESTAGRKQPQLLPRRKRNSPPKEFPLRKKTSEFTIPSMSGTPKALLWRSPPTIFRKCLPPCLGERPPHTLRVFSHKGTKVAMGSAKKSIPDPLRVLRALVRPSLSQGFSVEVSINRSCDSVSHQFFPEIDEKSKFHIREIQVCQQLLFPHESFQP